VTWEDYLGLGEDSRAEFIDGQLVMSPSPTFEHQEICFRLAAGLRRVVPAGHRVTQGWAWKPSEDEFIPDVMVVPDTGEQARFTGTPVLVIEVLSTNRSDDLVLKTGKYAAAGLPHYWIVDPRDRTFSAFVLQGGVYARAVHAC
jgi:Uma2 family endonuclease